MKAARPRRPARPSPPPSVAEAARDELSAPDLPSALERFDDIASRAQAKTVVVFLDYDGTLAPIADRPELARLAPDMRATVEELAKHCTVAVVSGRDLADIRKLIRIDGLFYAGGHGFDIADPVARKSAARRRLTYAPILRRAARDLRSRLRLVEGALIEAKKFSVAVHYRLAPGSAGALVEAAVDEVLERHPELRKRHGKKVLELQPAIDWDKGKATLWMLEAFALGGDDVLPFFIGDDMTDEDAFAALAGRGVGVAVGFRLHPTAASYTLADPSEVKIFLQKLTQVVSGRGD